MVKVWHKHGVGAELSTTSTSEEYNTTSTTSTTIRGHFILPQIIWSKSTLPLFNFHLCVEDLVHDKMFQALLSSINDFNDLYMYKPLSNHLHISHSQTSTCPAPTQHPLSAHSKSKVTEVEQSVRLSLRKSIWGIDAKNMHSNSSEG